MSDYFRAVRTAGANRRKCSLSSRMTRCPFEGEVIIARYAKTPTNKAFPRWRTKKEIRRFNA
jgi:hypothetical protein